MACLELSVNMAHGLPCIYLHAVLGITRSGRSGGPPADALNPTSVPERHIEMTTEISELLAEAQRRVDEAGLAPDLRPVAFGKVFDLLSGGSKIVERGSESGEPGVGSAIERIARRVNLEPGVVAEVYYEDGGDLGIGLGATRLDPSDAGATKQLALLLAGGRQASGQDEAWTSVAVIREACRDFGRLDTNNFATTVSSMNEVFTFRGKGQQREVRLTRPGWDALARLLSTFPGSSG
jgi:hypothetical protein